MAIRPRNFNTGFNMSFSEARRRCAFNNCDIVRTEYGDYRVTNRAWKRKIEDRAYYTDDLEDAVLTSARLVA